MSVRILQYGEFDNSRSGEARKLQKSSFYDMIYMYLRMTHLPSG